MNMQKNKTEVNRKKKLTRKEIRKEKRFEKKQRKVHFFAKRKELKDNWKKEQEPGRFVRLHKNVEDNSKKKNVSKSIKNSEVEKESVRNLQKEYEVEKKKLKKLEKEMKLQRIKALRGENEEEDRNIKQLEKKLKMNKRKSKALPKSFVDCGLDFILDVCDSKNVEAAVNAEINLKDSDSEYEEDLALITGKKSLKKTKNKSANKHPNVENDFDDGSDSEFSLDEDVEGEEDKEFDEELNEEEQEFEDDFSENESDYGNGQSLEVDGCKNSSLLSGNVAKAKSLKEIPEVNTNKKGILKHGSGGENLKRNSSENEGNILPKKRVRIQSESKSLDGGSDVEEQSVTEEQEYWEDIYGRTRDKAGNIVQVTKEKYIPPHLREKAGPEDSKRREQLDKIKKQLKGLLNRLAENNMHNISNQIDEMYMQNSRNDMNETLLNLYKDSLIVNVPTPERLIMEHAMLVAILHANVGTEIGAFFLQNLVKLFDELHSTEQQIEDKRLDNLILLLSHLYTFKIYNCELLYGLLGRFCDSFTPKDVDLILVVLRSVGFTLRKDDPLALKQLILSIQKLANDTIALKDDARFRFMLDVLLGIKNNNMNKLPGYDPSHAEHLKKIIKVMFRKGNYVTEMKISLEDILKADERGRWWIVGSAWTGPAPNMTADKSSTSSALKTEPSYSQEVLDLAKKQRMSTVNRKNIFCILMSAEDYLDAFEKLLRLGLKGQPEQEIVHVLIHCLLSEKVYNPYYALIADQLCMSDRKHQMTIQYSVWDRFKELKSLKKCQITNLAKFLAHLFLQKSLPISVLKVVEFVELDKPGVRLIRQVLMSLLLHNDKDSMIEVFNRIAKPAKLSQLRQSLILFLHHFIIRTTKSDVDVLDEEKLLQQRVEEVVKVLNCFDVA